MALTPDDCDAMIAAADGSRGRAVGHQPAALVRGRPPGQGRDRRRADRRARARDGRGARLARARVLRHGCVARDARPARAAACSSTRPSTSSTSLRWFLGPVVEVDGLDGERQPSRDRGRGHARSRSSGLRAAPSPRSSPATRRARACTPASTSTAGTARRSASRPTAGRSSWPGLSLPTLARNDLWTIPGEEDGSGALGGRGSRRPSPASTSQPLPRAPAARRRRGDPRRPPAGRRRPEAGRRSS